MINAKSRNSLRGAITDFSKMVMVSLVVLIAVASVTVQVVRVEGPIYNKIVLGKDLIADILPPPEYVIEAYLEATLAVADPSTIEARGKRLKALESDYNTRQAYWASSSLSDKLKGEITGASNAPAHAFWREINDQFVPALRAGDTARAQTSYRKLGELYAVHRAAIDELVTDATAEGERTETLTTPALIGFSLIIIALGGFNIWMVRSRTRRIAADVIDPMTDLTRVMAALADGERSVEIPFTARQDEVGDMARALVQFRDQGQDRIRLQAEQETSRREQVEAQTSAAQAQAVVVDGIAAGLASLAGGDLTVRLHDVFPGRYDRLREDFNVAAEKLDDALALVNANTQGIVARVDQIAGAHVELAKRTSQQAANVEDTGRTLQGIADAVRQSARATAQASDAVLAAKVEAERSDGVISKTVTAMSEIVESTHQISQIVEVIDGIAFQTNLLALNAGVEAARAGDSGRGFAVVATEVRALAQHTAGRAKDITQLIRTSKALVDSGKDYVTDTGDTLRRIVGQVAELAEFVSRIADATQEQAGRLGAVNMVSSDMEADTHLNARMTEDCSEAVMRLQQQAGELGSVVGRFTLSAHEALNEDQAHTGARRPEVGRSRSAINANILIADDNEVNRTIAAKICKAFGCTTTSVADGEGAVAAVRGGRFDMVLMDIMMPGMGGEAAIRAIRTLSGPSGQIPIIAVTANALEQNVSALRAAGVNSVVEKPISPKVLLDAIKSVTRPQGAARHVA